MSKGSLKPYINYVNTEDQTLKRLVSLSAFETFGQFTATLKLLWAPDQLFLTPNNINIVRDKTIRLGRKWLERGEPRVFWLDDAEHLGIRLRARQSNDSPTGQALDEDESSWEMDVEGMIIARRCSMKGCVLIIGQRFYSVLFPS